MDIIGKISLKIKEKVVDGKDCKISISPNLIICSFSYICQSDKISYILGKLNGADDEFDNIVDPNDVISFYDLKIVESNKYVVVNSFQIDPKPSSIRITINSIEEKVEIKFKKITLKKTCNVEKNVFYFNNFVDLIQSKNGCNLKYKNKEYCFSYDTINKVIAVSYDKEDSISIKNLLLLISLYYRFPIEYYRHDYTKNGFLYMSFRKIRSTDFDGNISNPMYIIKINGISNVQDFISFANINLYFKNGDLFQRVINNYVNSQYYDVIGEFISLCLSIICLEPLLVPNNKELIKKLGREHISEFDRVVYLFDQLYAYGGSKIDFEKLNAPLKKLNKDMTTDRNKGKHIETFIDLRNEIIHGLQSHEIYNFLEDDNRLITRLELLNFVMISNMLGINKIEIRRNFKYFNIFGIIAVR